PPPGMDVHNVKERGHDGTVVTGVESHDPGARTQARALPAHELSFDVLRLDLRAIYPPASAAEGGPCAGYSGLHIERCPARSIDLQEPRYARAPRVVSGEEETPSGFPSSFHASSRLGCVGLTAQAV